MKWKKLLVYVLMAPLLALLTVRIYWFARKLRRQLPHGATRRQLGYASAEFMKDQMGYAGLLMHIKRKASLHTTDDFDQGVAQWRIENVPQEV